MTGFRIDPEALEAAIRKLEDARDSADQLGREAAEVTPGELTAKDSVTGQARDLFKKRASDGPESLRGSATAIRDLVQQKIDDYRATLEEYRRSEDNATVDADRVDKPR